MNARTHTEKQVSQIAESIQKFGFNNPILIDAEGVIIAGHGRVMAAKKMGLDSVPCLVLAHLTEEQKKAFVLADNKIAMNAGWNAKMLEEELKSISDGLIKSIGFSDKELSNLLGDLEPTLEEVKEESEKIKSEFEKKVDREHDEKKDVLDSEFWFCVCFKSRKDREKFLKKFGLIDIGEKYLDGYSVEEILEKGGK